MDSRFFVDLIYNCGSYPYITPSSVVMTLSFEVSPPMLDNILQKDYLFGKKM